MSAKTASRSAVPRWARILITLAVIVGAGALILSQLPRGAFSTDLARVGQGTPALVVARDINFLAGAEVMDLLNTIRPDYAHRVEFLAAHLGHPDGRSFAQRHGMRDGTVALFAGDGTRLTVISTPQTQGEIRQALDDASIR